MAAAARRFGIVLGALAGGTAVLALLFGLALGSSVSRSLSLGWYIVGSVLLISGFFVGNRGPSRPVGEGWGVFSLQRWVRWATPDEQRETLSLSAVLVVLGFVLIALGVLADTRYAIV
ncbi:MAG: hypothetical protein JWO17_3009 [Actinomycetia bacterium]|jgi:hypothetical protein|nr:hypothetical protein [Actinomycetes bacterium]